MGIRRMFLVYIHMLGMGENTKTYWAILSIFINSPVNFIYNTYILAFKMAANLI